MWLINVVIIITFIFFVSQILYKAIRDKDTFMYSISVLAVVFEVVCICYIFSERKANNLVQSLILIFAYIVPMVIVLLKLLSNNTKLKLLYLVSEIAYALGRYEFVSGLLYKAIKKDKTNSKLYYLRGKALEQENCLTDARDMFFKVIELDKNNLEAYLDVANILDKLDKKDTAIVMLAQALKQDSTFEPAKEMMGIIYSEIGRYAEAASIYEELAMEGEATYTTYYNLAIIYYTKREIDKAIDAYNKVVELNPRLLDAYYGLGKLYIYKEQYEQAIQYLLKASKSLTLKAKSYYSLALCYIKLGEEDKSIKYLKETIKIDKEYLEQISENPEFLDVVKELENDSVVIEETTESQEGVENTTIADVDLQKN